MPKNALIYAWTIITIGIVVLGFAALGWQSSNLQAFLVCLGLTAFAATLKFQLPKMTGMLSPAFVPLLVSVATRSWSETVVIGAVLGIVQTLWRPKNRPTPMQIAFNGANLAIDAGVAYGLARVLMVAGGTDVMVVILGVAGVALLVTNTLILSTILCLIKDAPFMTAWRSLHLWSVPYYLAGGVLANVWARADLTAHIGVIVLAATSVYLLSVCLSAAAQSCLSTVRTLVHIDPPANLSRQ